MPEENKNNWVTMVYVGTHGGPVQYRGYLNRKYSVKAGDEPLVHPQDVPRLEKIVVKGKKMFARKQVAAPVAAASEPTPAKTVAPVAPDEVNDHHYPITEKALALATEAGLDLATLTGTGKDGLITVADVRQAIANLTGHE
ncbi:MAG: E3 binding domain-containing protein [Candidatus Competibacter sp.]